VSTRSRQNRKGGPPIKTLSDICTQTGAIPKVLRTLAVEHGIAFERLASGWIFSDVSAERLNRAFERHCEKCRKAGVKPPLAGQAEPFDSQAASVAAGR
jgi:hypothetical protein